MSTTVQNNVVDSSLLATMNGTASGTSKTSAQDAQDKFMTLLVTQMKNQDPLNPMDNAQVTSQLAQLSTVSGIDKLNATVTALNANFQTGQNLQSASMIGHGVLAQGNAINLVDGKSIYGIELPLAADKVDVTIRDSSGVVVRKISVGSLPAGVNALTWDGKTDAGAVAPNDVYKFDVSASTAGKDLAPVGLAFGVVSSVTSNAQGVKLNVANVGDINTTDVRQIY
ncbi:MAG: flagellar hook assembly protein FlgD [Burkholderiales bacterium]|nr:flagellar hook assembly protein FlgD [Burkholderiales bacterium]